MVWTTPPAPETTHADTTSHQPVSVELTPPDTSSLNATIHAPATLETTPPAPETTPVDTTSHQPVSVELTPPDTSSLNATIHAPPL
ncbi:unnamed protein product [Rhizophagus irregularis]|nr:unnamed protein product [Rhizophagus irregularis]